LYTLGDNLGDAFSVLTFAMVLLLAFRANNAYSRWWEARTVWGALVNDTRAAAAQALSYLPDPAGQKVAVWIKAYTMSMVWHARDEMKDCPDEASRILVREGVEELAAYHCTQNIHWVNFTLYTIHRLLYHHFVRDESAELKNSIFMTHLGPTINQLFHHLGKTERIMKTPIALNYTVHSSRFLLLWLCLLPFSVIGPLQWATIPFVALSTFMVVGIDEVAVQIEEPFTILPLEAICKTICANIDEMMDDRVIVEGIADGHLDHLSKNPTIKMFASRALARKQERERSLSRWQDQADRDLRSFNV
jgi:ion channel-forming bestrophin family protein